MILPSGSSIGSPTDSTSRSTSLGAVAPSRSPSVPTWLICRRAAAIAEAMRVSLFVDGIVGSCRRRPGGADRQRPGGARRELARGRGGRRACLRSGAEDSGGDPQAGGGGGVAGLVLARGDLAGDRAELGGDRRLAGLDALERVEDQVVLCAARGEHADDVLEAAAADVGDVGLHVAGPRAGPGSAPDALLEAGLDPRQVEMHDHRAVLQVVALARDRAEAEDRELALLERALESREGDLVDRAVGDVRLDAVTFTERAGELAQAVDALGEHEDLLLAGDAGDRLRGDAAQQRLPVAAAAHG